MFLNFCSIVLDFIKSNMQFILETIVSPLISSSFIVIGGAVPIVILIYFFSRQEKGRLLEHAQALEKTLPLQEQLLKKMAELIQATWVLQKSLHSSMESPAMKKLQRVCTDCYLAARATGAGGGGCMIFYVKPEKKRNLMGIFNKMQKHLPRMRVLPFKFDYDGIRIEK